MQEQQRIIKAPLPLNRVPGAYFFWVVSAEAAVPARHPIAGAWIARIVAAIPVGIATQT